MYITTFTPLIVHETYYVLSGTFYIYALQTGGYNRNSVVWTKCCQWNLI